MCYTRKRDSYESRVVYLFLKQNPSYYFLGSLMQVETSLLREKFDIKEVTAKKTEMAGQEMCARSNRIELNLQADQLAKETFIIRTDSMHLCARMAGQILENYENKGPFAPRLNHVKWDIIWDTALSDFEKRYNTGRWVVVYHKGKIVYAEGEHHSFLDIIEQFQSEEGVSYSDSLKLAEKAFQKAGRDVTIEYSSNVALALNMTREGGRCSTMLRAPKKTTTFHFYLKPKEEDEKISISQGLISAGNFLEGVNLSYFIGIVNAQIAMGEIDQYSNDGIQMSNAQRRIGDIQTKINSLENRYDVRYRPERPMFDLIIGHIVKYAMERIRRGDW
jgi:hypothetical protein